MEDDVTVKLDIEDLQRTAEAAKEADKTHTGLYPAGVWHVVKYGDEQSPGICVHSGDAWRVCFMATIQSQKDYEHQMAKAKHIAAANPATVLKFIAAYEAMEAENKALREALEPLIEIGNSRCCDAPEWRTDDMVWGMVYIADLRRARKALGAE